MTEKLYKGNIVKVLAGDTVLGWSGVVPVRWAHLTVPMARVSLRGWIEPIQLPGGEYYVTQEIMDDKSLWCESCECWHEECICHDVSIPECPCGCGQPEPQRGSKHYYDVSQWHGAGEP